MVSTLYPFPIKMQLFALSNRLLISALRQGRPKPYQIRQNSSLAPLLPVY